MECRGGHTYGLTDRVTNYCEYMSCSMQLKKIHQVAEFLQRNSSILYWSHYVSLSLVDDIWKWICEGNYETFDGIDETKRALQELVHRRNCLSLPELYPYLQYPLPMFDCADEGSAGLLVVTTELVWEGDQPEDEPLVGAWGEGLGGCHQTRPRVSPARSGIMGLATIPSHTGLRHCFGTEDVITGDDDLIMDMVKTSLQLYKEWQSILVAFVTPPRPDLRDLLS